MPRLYSAASAAFRGARSPSTKAIGNDVAVDDENVSHVPGVSDRQRYVRVRLLRNPKKDALRYLSTAPVPGKFAGAGGTGAVAIFTVTPALQQYFLGMLSRLTHRVGRASMPAVGSRVVVKVAALVKGRDTLIDRTGQRKADVRYFVHEAAVQKYVYGSCIKGIACGKEIVPKLFFSGLDPGYGVYIIAMEAVDGMELEKYLKSHPLNAQLFARLEKVLTTLWLLGVVHNDAHFNNIFVQKNGWPILIDLGQSVVIPKSKRARTVGNVFRSKFRGRIQGVASRVQYDRGYNFSNPDTKALRVLYSRVRDRERIPEERAKLWPGYVLPASAVPGVRPSAVAKSQGARPPSRTSKSQKSQKKKSQKKMSKVGDNAFVRMEADGRMPSALA